jgi:chloride channel 3/4/5
MYQGPLVHVSCCMSFLFMRLFSQFHRNEGTCSRSGTTSLNIRSSTKTEDSGGRCRCRGLRGLWKPAWWSPLRPRGYAGAFPFNVFARLSIVSELDAFGGDSDVMWRGFVTSVIAAVALQYVDPFRTSKLVLFQVCFAYPIPYKTR